MILRSLLLVRPDSGDALARASESGADALILDMAGTDRAALRRTAAFLAATPTTAIFVRLGPLAATGSIVALDALIPARPAGVILSGSTGGADVTRLSALLRPREAMAGLADGTVRIIAMATDTAAGLLALGTYAGASRRLMALAWDAEPLATALGAEDTAEVEGQARAGTLLAAAAASVVALDRPFRRRDLGALAAESEAARRIGFSGKLATAADQIAIINAAFSAGTNR